MCALDSDNGDNVLIINSCVFYNGYYMGLCVNSFAPTGVYLIKLDEAFAFVDAMCTIVFIT